MTCIRKIVGFLTGRLGRPDTHIRFERRLGLLHRKHVPGGDLCQIQGVVDRWVTFWRTARCQNNHGGGLPISAPHCCYFWGVVTPLGGWLLVVVLFWRMVSKGRAGDDCLTIFSIME